MAPLGNSSRAAFAASAQLLSPPLPPRRGGVPIRIGLLSRGDTAPVCFGRGGNGELAGVRCAPSRPSCKPLRTRTKPSVGEGVGVWLRLPNTSAGSPGTCTFEFSTSLSNAMVCWFFPSATSDAAHAFSTSTRRRVSEFSNRSRKRSASSLSTLHSSLSSSSCRRDASHWLHLCPGSRRSRKAAHSSRCCRASACRRTTSAFASVLLRAKLAAAKEAASIIRRRVRGTACRAEPRGTGGAGNSEPSHDACAMALDHASHSKQSSAAAAADTAAGSVLLPSFRSSSEVIALALSVSSSSFLSSCLGAAEDD